MRHNLCRRRWLESAFIPALGIICRVLLTALKIRETRHFNLSVQTSVLLPPLRFVRPLDQVRALNRYHHDSIGIEQLHGYRIQGFIRFHGRARQSRSHFFSAASAASRPLPLYFPRRLRMKARKTGVSMIRFIFCPGQDSCGDKRQSNRR